jgi:hypothetical protein
MMNILETEWWSLVVPPEWWAETEDDSILVGDRDEVGCIEISTLHKEQGVFDADGLLEIARSESPDISAWQAVELGDFSGWTGGAREESAAIREWYVARDALLLFITYSCDEDNSGLDDAAVDELLDTLVQLPADSVS